MHRHRTDRIINPEVIQQTVSQIHHQTADKADKQCYSGIHHMGTGGNGHHTGNHAIQRIDRINQAPAPPGQAHAAEDAGDRRQHRIGDDRRHALVETEGTASIETKPAKQQQQGAKHRHGQVRTRQTAALAWQVIATLTRTQHQNHRQRYPAAHPVHHGRAGKIDKTARCQPTFAFGKAASPGPVTKKGIDQSGCQRRYQQIATEAHAFGGGARHNGCGRGAEHGLEQEKRRLPGIIEGQQQKATARPAAVTQTKHDAEAEQPVQQDGHTQVSHVLDRYIDSVLAAGQPRLKAQESQLHVKHQAGTEYDPEDIKHGNRHGEYLQYGTVLARPSGARLKKGQVIAEYARISPSQCKQCRFCSKRVGMLAM